MKNPNTVAGTHSHAFKPLRTVRTGEIDGEPVVYIPLAKGKGEVLMSLETWKDRRRAGYSPNLFLKPNGKGRSYPASRAYGPDPLQPKGGRDTVREVAALKMLREESQGGARAVAKGWVAKTLNGDPNDLRDCNVVTLPAPGRRNTFVAVWDAKVRLKLADRGIDPNTAFRADRRKAAMLGVRNKLEDMPRPLRNPRAPAASPRPVPHQGPAKSGQ